KTELGQRWPKLMVDMVGKTPIALAMAFMQKAKSTIGIAAGLPIIAAQLGWRTVIMWPVHGISKSRVCEQMEHGYTPEFPESWVPPGILSSGSYCWWIIADNM